MAVYDKVFLRSNYKWSFLGTTILYETDMSFDIQDIDYGGAEKDRNIPQIADVRMALVIWSQLYPNPSAAPDKEIVWAKWDSGQTYTIIERGAEDTTPSLHTYGDNVALLWSAYMNWDVCVFRKMLNDIIGSIGYTDDTDPGDEAMEVEPLQPDDETLTDRYGNVYTKILVTQGAGLPPKWEFSWDVGGDRPLT